MKNLMIALIALIISMNHSLFAQTVYQAEDAYEIYLGVLETTNGGYTGTGYVNGDNVIGTHIIFSVSADSTGPRDVTIFYTNGSTNDRKLEVSVNSAVVMAEVSFLTTGDWTTWTSQTFSLDLLEGVNYIKLTSLVESGAPNIDKIEVSGSGGEQFYQLTLKKWGEGTVIKESEDSLFSAGTEVMLMAEAADQYSFGGWFTDKYYKGDTLILKMDSAITVEPVFIQNGLYADFSNPIGWVNYTGVVTGGEGGTIVTATNQSELQSYIGSSSEYIIQVQGTIEISPFGYEIPVGSNTTVIGLGDSAVIKGGGLLIGSVNNVIIKNITFKDAYVTWDGKTTDNDAIEINNSQKVWVDHCDFSHYDDGLIDIKNASDYITVSWCRFHNENKVMLIGAGDDATQDRDHLNTTVHHCWFDGRYGNGIHQRVPRVRFGKVHVYNNFYNKLMVRGPLAGFEGNVKLENSYFLDSKDCHMYTKDGSANYMDVSGNILINNYGDLRVKSGSFNPVDYYSYELHETEDVPVLAMLGAGVGKDSIVGNTIPYISDVEDKQSFTQTGSLHQNYPNPFSDYTIIPYSVSELSQVIINLYTITGEKIETLVNEIQQPGNYQYYFKPRNVKPGVYLYQMITSKGTETKRMILLE